MFSSDDWEELYAFVELIDGVAGTVGYLPAWAAWAEEQGKQSTEQWRQYYEKVVHPQWLRDPSWKREQIKLKMEAKHSEDSSQSQREIFIQEEEASTEHGVFAGTSKPYTTVQPEVGNEEIADPVPDTDGAAERESAFSDAVHPRKRTRFQEQEHEHRTADEKRSAKRHRSASLEILLVQDSNITGTQNQPMEISSAENSDVISSSESADEQVQDQITQDMARKSQAGMSQSIETNEVIVASRASSVAADDDVEEAKEAEEDEEDDLPTPRPPRQPTSKFDTQAILSSPSQDSLGIGLLPA